MSDYLSCSFLGCPKCPDTLDLISGPAAGVTHTLINQTKGDYHSMDHDEFSRKLNEIKERVLSSSTPEEETQYTESLFESIKHIDENGDEFWYARELQRALVN